jgi:small subunit ribosomal protein S16
MSVKIRLRRIGRKKQPSYRVVVIESTMPHDGAYIDAIGFYNPRRSPRAELRLDMTRVDYWVDKGADMSDTVASLVRKARKGGDAKVEIMPLGGQDHRREPDAGEATEPAPPAAAAAADAANEAEPEVEPEVEAATVEAAPAPEAAAVEEPAEPSEPADAAQPAESAEPDAPAAEEEPAAG